MSKSTPLCPRCETKLWTVGVRPNTNKTDTHPNFRAIGLRWCPKCKEMFEIIAKSVTVTEVST